MAETCPKCLGSHPGWKLEDHPEFCAGRVCICHALRDYKRSASAPYSACNGTEPAGVDATGRKPVVGDA